MPKVELLRDIVVPIMDNAYHYTRFNMFVKFKCLY